MRAADEGDKDDRRPNSTSSLPTRSAIPSSRRKQLPQIVEAIAKSRREANKVKREEPITVVIGNPPYKEKAEGTRRLDREGARQRAARAADRWKPPREWGVGAHAQASENLYVYFWRWATWKVFGSAACRDRPAGYDEKVSSASSRSPAFSTGRASRNARRSAPDCSDDLGDRLLAGGPPADVADAYLPGRATAVCIVLAARRLGRGLEQAGACAVSRAAEGQARREVRRACGPVSGCEGLGRLSRRLACAFLA